MEIQPAAMEDTTTISNSTISGNVAGRLGGALEVNGAEQVGRVTSFRYGSEPVDPFLNSKVIVLNSTITGNSAAEQGGGLYTGQAELDIANSIIAGNIASNGASELSHLAPTVVTDEVSSRNNLFGTSLISNFQAFTYFVPGTTDITATIDGTTPTLLESIINPLDDNGGPTLTHSLPAGSPAFGNGDLGTCVDEPIANIDQRGEARSNTCNIGAYEESVNTKSAIALEGDNQFVQFTVTLDQPQPDRFAVDFQTQSSSTRDPQARLGAAMGDVDYESRIGTMTFQPGQTVKRRWVRIIDDGTYEFDERFRFIVSSVDEPSNAVVGIGTIIDDEIPSVPIITVDREPALFENLFENRPIAPVFIRLSEPLDTAVSVSFTTRETGSATGGEDFIERTGTMNFAPGQTVKVRNIELVDDSVIEDTESFDFRLIQVGSETVLGDDRSVTINILDND